jgi:hypothetical protein
MASVYPDFAQAERIQRRLRISFDLADRLTVATARLRTLADDKESDLSADDRWAIRMFLRLTSEETLNQDLSDNGDD